MLDIEEIEKYVKKNMSSYRFKHTLGVVKVAKELSNIYGIDSNKAVIAALLHDLAKEISTSDKKRLCKEYHIDVDEYMNNNINLTHGMIAAYIAKKKLNIQDCEVLNAIANHTLGRENMSILEKIIYLADIIEPSRTTYPGLEKLTELAYKDLDQAMRFALYSTIQHLKSKNKEVHPLIYSILECYKEV